MKKFLLGIVALFVGFIGFSSAGEITINGNISNISTLYAGTVFGGIRSPFSSAGTFNYNCSFSNFNGTISDSTNVRFQAFSSNLAGSNLRTFSSSAFRDGLGISGYSSTSSLQPIYFAFTLGVSNSTPFSFDYSCVFSGVGISSSPSSSDISVFYNGYNNSQTFVCDGDTSIYLDGNFNFTQSNNLFTPYFNIHYTDGDNQVLTGQYDKTDLYLEGQYNKSYTGGSNNYWVFDPIISNNSVNISGYVPVFNVEFTGDTFQDTGNIFNNFAENSLKLTLSNIPSYIQYVILIAILFFILGFIKKFKR